MSEHTHMPPHPRDIRRETFTHLYPDRDALLKWFEHEWRTAFAAGRQTEKKEGGVSESPKE